MEFSPFRLSYDSTFVHYVFVHVIQFPRLGYFLIPEPVSALTCSILPLQKKSNNKKGMENNVEMENNVLILEIDYYTVYQ